MSTFAQTIIKTVTLLAQTNNTKQNQVFNSTIPTVDSQSKVPQRSSNSKVHYCAHNSSPQLTTAHHSSQQLTIAHNSTPQPTTAHDSP
jgi:hypothetical protein